MNPTNHLTVTQKLYCILYITSRYNCVTRKQTTAGKFLPLLGHFLNCSMAQVVSAQLYCVMYSP